MMIGIVGEPNIALFLKKEDISWISSKLIELKNRLERKYSEFTIVTNGNMGIENMVCKTFNKLVIINPIPSPRDNVLYHITGSYEILSAFCDMVIVFTHNRVGNNRLDTIIKNSSQCLIVDYNSKQEKWLKKELQ